MIGAHVVTVAGVDLSCWIDEVSITHGRSDTTSQPEPSSCTLDLTAGHADPLPTVLDIGALIVVTTTVAGTSSIRFKGRVTDLAMGWDDAGANTPDAGIGQVVAVGALADYARRIVGDEPFPQELDGQRVARVFALAGLTLDPGKSDPGVAQVIPRDIDARAALEVARSAAESAGGLVWETRDGLIRYADAEHRRGIPVALDLDSCDVLVTPTWTRTLSGLVNQIRIGYGVAPEGGGEAPSFYADAEDSVATYGRYEYSVTTELALLADAQATAWLILAQNSAPAWTLNAIPVDLGDLTQAQTIALLGLDVHSLIRVTGLPAISTTPTSVASWVEGWTEHLANGVHDLDLTVSDYCRTAPGVRWNDLSLATTWNTYGPGTWNQATCAGAPVPSRGFWDDVSASLRWDDVAPAMSWDAWVG